METYALYISYSQSDVYVIVAISHLYAIFLFCIYIAFILNAMYMHLKQTHLYAIRSTMRYITHSKYRNWSKCDVRRILNCDIYRIYFLNAMYVASACGVLIVRARESPDDPPRIMGGRLNKLVALNFISVFLFSLCYRSNRVIALGVLSVFLFTFSVGFVGSWRRPGAADVDWW